MPSGSNHSGTQQYDAYQLDDILLALLVVGLMSLVYSGLRVWDLRQEVALRSAAQQSAAWITTHDGLTALFKWRSFEERIVSNAACVSKAPLAVFSICIDDFKQINDVAACDFVYSQTPATPQARAQSGRFKFEIYSPTEVRENPDGDDAVYCGRSPSRREQTGPSARLARFCLSKLPAASASRRYVGWRQSSPPSSPESSELSSLLSSLLSSAVSLESASADSSWVRSSSTVASSLSSEVSISVDSAETYSS